jgi:DNA segregation ATPase FtsK/SpoIIIE, S-DNA-T family
LLTPVVTDPMQAVNALNWVLNEMQRRYAEMAKVSVRNIAAYNELSAVVELPYIVVVIDEVADLMMVAGKEVEQVIQRLAAMARAAGIHLILATQRTSTDVITGTIKANFPTKISFKVGSKIDSRVVLGESGAEQLLGAGDMMMLNNGVMLRAHGAYLSDAEVVDFVARVKIGAEPTYIAAVTAFSSKD